MDNKSLLVFVGGVLTAVVLGGGYLLLTADSGAPLSMNTQEEEGTTQEGNTANGSTNTGGNGASAPQRVMENGAYVYIVNFNNDTFSPPVITIKRGESVRFVNKDNLSMRISATLDGAPSEEIKSSTSVARNGSYTFNFNTPGIWVIRNLNDTINPGGGVVYVE